MVLYCFCTDESALVDEILFLHVGLACGMNCVEISRALHVESTRLRFPHPKITLPF